MPADFPTSLDSFTDPVAGQSRATVSEVDREGKQNDAIEKIEVKVGVGASPASSADAGDVLTAAGDGSSAWAPPSGTSVTVIDPLTKGYIAATPIFASVPTGGNMTLIANRAEIVPFFLDVPITINRVIWRHNSGSGSFDVGIYDDDGTGGAPLTRLASSGSFTPATGGAGISSSIGTLALSPGRYYAAVVANAADVIQQNSDGLQGVGANGKLRYVQTAAFPLPAALASPSEVTDGVVPIIFAGSVG